MCQLLGSMSITKWKIRQNIIPFFSLCYQMRQTLIRSQFACTYKDDCTMGKNRWNGDLSSEPAHALRLENDVSGNEPRLSN